MTKYLLISDAAKEVKVESHVLRYWEEELHLPIKRNELGHRYYTEEDVERFKEIKNMKERGLQLKAIKMILRDGQLDIFPQENSERQPEREMDTPADMAIDIIHCRELEAEKPHSSAPLPQKKVDKPESREEKAQRLQWILQQLIRETLQENNQELCREMKESIVKELDYQFRAREEREEEREQKLVQRNEEYYQRMDELLRNKTRRFGKKDSIPLGKRVKEADGMKKSREEEDLRLGEDSLNELRKAENSDQKQNRSGKKRRHSIF